jgi:hypothetical protein
MKHALSLLIILAVVLLYAKAAHGDYLKYSTYFDFDDNCEDNYIKYNDYLVGTCNSGPFSTSSGPFYYITCDNAEGYKITTCPDNTCKSGCNTTFCMDHCYNEYYKHCVTELSPFSGMYAVFSYGEDASCSKSSLHTIHTQPLNQCFPVRHAHSRISTYM